MAKERPRERCSVRAVPPRKGNRHRCYPPSVRWLGRPWRRTPIYPAGWVCVAKHPDGTPIYGYIGSRTPRWYFRDLEDMRDRWGRSD